MDDNQCLLEELEVQSEKVPTAGSGWLSARPRCAVTAFIIGVGLAVVVAVSFFGGSLRVAAVSGIMSAAEPIDLKDTPFANKPELCDPGIVQSTCKALLPESKRSGDAKSLSVTELQQILFSVPDPRFQPASDAITKVLDFLSIPTQGDVDCTTLCASAVTHLKTRKEVALPSKSDVGCYDSGGSKIVCDIDLSPDKIKKLVTESNLDVYKPFPMPVATKDNNQNSESLEKSAVAFQDDIGDVVVRLAQLFRIFPVTIRESDGALEDAEKLVIAKKALVLSKGYVMNAVRKHKLKDSMAAAEKWFGKDAVSDPDLWGRLQEVVGAIAAMMDNIKFKFPQCQPNVFGYVSPGGPDAKDPQTGEFVMFLCPLFFEKKDEQIETIIHEISHHAVSFENDACMNPKGVYTTKDLSSVPKEVRIGEFTKIEDKSYEVMLFAGQKAYLREGEEGVECTDKAYGRESCAKLAQEDTIKALSNADNVCFYVQDVSDVSELSSNAE